MKNVTTENYLAPYAEKMVTDEIFVDVELAHGNITGFLQKLDVENGIYWVNDCKFWLESNKFTTLFVNENVKSGAVQIPEIGYNPELEKTLSNGVQVYNLDIFPDFKATQEIFDINHHTENIDSECAYNERVSNDFVGTYKTFVERSDDYNRFKDMLSDAILDKRRGLINAFRLLYERGLTTFDEFDKYRDSCYYECTCKMCSFRFPTIEEWKKGKYQINDKQIGKIGKSLTKAGFPQNVIDFYSTQIKTEKEIFVTISDLPQHIAGMSNLAEEDSWDSYGGTSCQDTRHESEESIALAGSLYDDKLFVAMLHADLSDIEEMQDKLIARSVMRLVHVDYMPMLVATDYYGNNETKDILHSSLGMLSECDIYNRDIRRGGKTTRHTEPANGAYELTTTDSVHVQETVESEGEIDCDMCSGRGDYEVTNNNDKEVTISCPACSGDGTVYASSYIEVDEWIEVEDVENVTPYDEGYTHDEHCIRISIDIERVRELRVGNGLTLA